MISSGFKSISAKIGGSNKKDEEKEPRFFDVVSRTIEEWDDAASKAKVSTTALGEYADLRSGSNVTQKQYLLFRTLVIKNRISSFDPKEFEVEHKISKAKELLKKSREFCDFIQAIKDNTYRGKDNFALVRNTQKEILRQPPNGKKIKGPSNVDESPINSSFINLLIAIADIAPDCLFDWRFTKARLHAEFRVDTQSGKKRKRSQKHEKREKREFTAITDGQLQDRETYEIKTIIECKADRRVDCVPAVDMQEAAQMVAWIKQYPNDERQRVIVAQNYDRIYVTFSQYSDSWLSYLNFNRIETKDFMYMHQFGPYHIHNYDHMKVVAEILLALVL